VVESIHTQRIDTDRVKHRERDAASIILWLLTFGLALGDFGVGSLLLGLCLGLVLGLLSDWGVFGLLLFSFRCHHCLFV